MKFIATALLAGTFAASAAGADVVSWKDLQSMGGFAIDQPIRSSSGWLLPVRGDVSGLAKVTTKSTQLNSGIACAETLASVDGRTISLVVTTGLAGSRRSAKCPAANLGAIAPGQYSVQYHAANEPAQPLGSVVIAP